MDIEEDAAARELKELLCKGCYPALIGWVTGRSNTPFTPCEACAPVAQRWLEERRSERGN